MLLVLKVIVFKWKMYEHTKKKSKQIHLFQSSFKNTADYSNYFYKKNKQIGYVWSVICQFLSALTLSQEFDYLGQKRNLLNLTIYLSSI